MTTVQNLLCMRQHDPVLAAVWDAEHIEQVEVLWEEDLALEGRRLLHDTGALKDVMQNHMLQLLSLLAMELPAGGYHHHIAANTWESAGAGAPPPGSAALRFATIVVPDAGERERALARLAALGHQHRDDGADPIVVDPSGNPVALTVRAGPRH